MINSIGSTMTSLSCPTNQTNGRHFYLSSNCAPKLTIADLTFHYDISHSFGDRFRMRLEDIVNLSRRSLFGRIVRLPSLLPFKRQQDESATKNNAKASNPSEPKVKQRRRRRLFRRNSRRHRKETDRQMIQINGKQYYVSDEGELKELKKDEDSS